MGPEAELLEVVRDPYFLESHNRVDGYGILVTVVRPIPLGPALLLTSTTTCICKLLLVHVVGACPVNLLNDVVNLVNFLTGSIRADFVYGFCLEVAVDRGYYFMIFFRFSIGHETGGDTMRRSSGCHET